jgi:hypothetical protein
MAIGYLNQFGSSPLDYILLWVDGLFRLANTILIGYPGLFARPFAGEWTQEAETVGSEFLETFNGLTLLSKFGPRATLLEIENVLESDVEIEERGELLKRGTYSHLHNPLLTFEFHRSTASNSGNLVLSSRGTCILKKGIRSSSLPIIVCLIGSNRWP